jgi:hypothetical protein
MKKTLFSITSIALAGVILTFSACKKADTTPPVITLTGANPLTLHLGDTYTEPGFTATDNVDGDVKSKVAVTGTVNTSQVGAYTLTYNVSDAAGNAATAQTRTVDVQSDYLVGSYAVTDFVTGSNAGTYTYNVTVTQSGTDYNKLLFGNFGGFGASVSVYANVSGTVITIPSQQPSGVPLSGTSISGTGTYTGSGTSWKITSITYTATYPTPPGGADNGASTYVKQ